MKKIKNMVISLIIFFTGLTLVGWGGCGGSIPDVKPFAEQTARMSSAIDNGYSQAELLLSLTDESPNGLEKQWQQTRSALEAVVAYSDALATLADAGAEGSEVGQSLADAVQGLISSVSPFTIPKNIVGAFNELNKTITAIRVRKKLKEAVGDAQPAINIISQVVSANLEELERINHVAGKVIENQHTQTHRAMVNYFSNLLKEDNRILEILALIIDYQAGDSDVRELIIQKDVILKEKKEQNVKITDHDIEQRQSFWLAQSKAIQDEMKRYRDQYEAYNKGLAEIKQNTIKGGAIIRKSKTAIEAWARAHSKMKTGLDEEKRMSFFEFARVIQDIYDEYQKGGM